MPVYGHLALDRQLVPGSVTAVAGGNCCLLLEDLRAMPGSAGAPDGQRQEAREEGLTVHEQ